MRSCTSRLLLKPVLMITVPAISSSIRFPSKCLAANCGWARGKADVLYVANTFEVIARLNELEHCAQAHEITSVGSDQNRSQAASAHR